MKITSIKDPIIKDARSLSSVSNRKELNKAGPVAKAKK